MENSNIVFTETYCRYWIEGAGETELALSVSEPPWQAPQHNHDRNRQRDDCARLVDLERGSTVTSERRLVNEKAV